MNYSFRQDLGLWLYWFNKFYSNKRTKPFMGKLCIEPADIPFNEGTVQCWFEIYLGTDFDKKIYTQLRRFFPKTIFTIDGEIREDKNYCYIISGFEGEEDSWNTKPKEASSKPKAAAKAKAEDVVK